RLVLGRGGDDVTATALARCSLDREVIRLRRSRREDDLLGPRVDRARNRVSRRLDGVERLRAEGMACARGVAEHLREVRRHRRKPARIDWCGRVAIEINWQSHQLADPFARARVDAALGAAAFGADALRLPLAFFTAGLLDDPPLLDDAARVAPLGAS